MRSVIICFFWKSTSLTLMVAVSLTPKIWPPHKCHYFIGFSIYCYGTMPWSGFRMLRFLSSTLIFFVFIKIFFVFYFTMVWLKSIPWVDSYWYFSRNLDSACVLPPAFSQNRHRLTSCANSLWWYLFPLGAQSHSCSAPTCCSDLHMISQGEVSVIWYSIFQNAARFVVDPR